MSEKYGEDQPWHLTQEPDVAPSYEELEERIEALTAKVKLMDDLDVINGEKIEALEAKLAEAVEALRDLTNAFAKKVDVDQTRWKMPYEHPLSAYDRAVAFLKGDKP
jgi:hypothetical protein